MARQKTKGSGPEQSGPLVPTDSDPGPQLGSWFLDDLEALFGELKEHGTSVGGQWKSTAQVALTALDHAEMFGLACPRWALTEIAEAWRRYEALEVPTLDAAFGLPKRTHLKAKRNARAALLAYHLVRALGLRNVQQLDNSTSVGALSLVGDYLGISRSAVEKLMARYKAECAEAGHDPDEVGDDGVPASEVIAGETADMIIARSSPSRRKDHRKKRSTF